MAARENALEDVSTASLALHAQNFASEKWRKMLFLSLPTDSVGHYIRYANIKVFSEPNFPVYGQNLRTCTENTYQRKPVFLPFLPNVTHLTY